MNYAEEARKARLRVLGMIYMAQSSHIGSNYSCIDLLTVLFDKVDLAKDDVIFSKGWVAASAYYFLSLKGKIPKAHLKRFCMPDEEVYIGLVEPAVPGIECAGGSMGFGLPFGVGFALAKKLDKKEGNVYVLMSDGEIDCGTNWEASRIAKGLGLDNLTAIVDKNGLQAMGTTEEVLDTKPQDLFRGWQISTIDGHDYERIENALKLPPSFKVPNAIIAKTVKGKGVSFMENANIWHYKAPSEQEYIKAMEELCQR